MLHSNFDALKALKKPSIKFFGRLFRIFVTGKFKNLRYILFFLFLLISGFTAFTQPKNDSYDKAIVLTQLSDCSADAAYSNINATDEGLFGTPTQWPSGERGKDVWFRFTAIAYDVNITVTGASSGGGTTGGTLQNPLIALYTIENQGGSISSSVQVGSLATTGTSISSYYKGALIVGKDYYVRVSAKNNSSGTFKLCVNNYFAPLKAGQDFGTSSILCNKKNFTETNVSGSGTDNRETAGSCLNNESNSVWYKWTAANNGTLTMDITPSVNSDDIDWVLYDLGPSGDFSTKTLLRCAVGHGVNNDQCPTEPLYFKTGMNMSSTDITEESGCGKGGQDGYLKYVDMQQGHTYALLVDNYSNGNNGFKLEFGGTAEFVGPEAKIDFVKNSPCQANQSFTFNNTGSKNYSRVEWNFGEGANIQSANASGPHVITYSSSGFKTVVLQVFNDDNCSVSITESFYVGETPISPTITVNKTDFCLNDTIRLSTATQQDVIYNWTGPNNFSSNLQSPEIPVSSEAVSGTYTLTLSRGDCSTEPIHVFVPAIYKNPIAAFRAVPKPPAKLSFPIRVKFYNESKDGDAYLWNFGDNNTSTDKDPEHTYTTEGNFDVSLTVFKNSACSATVVHGTFMIRPNHILFIPNTFTPNNDASNDEFVVSMTNIKTYKIQIFSRLGTTVFVSYDLFKSWDGSYNNEPLPVGTYYYLIEASDFNDNIIKKTGFVTLIR